MLFLEGIFYLIILSLGSFLKFFFCLYIMFSGFSFLYDLCVCKCVCLCICLFPVPFFGFFLYSCLFCPIQICLFLFYLFVLSPFFPLDDRLLSNDREQERTQTWVEGKVGRIQEELRKGKHNQYIIYLKIYFQLLQYIFSYNYDKNPHF